MRKKTRIGEEYWKVEDKSFIRGERKEQSRETIKMADKRQD